MCRKNHSETLLSFPFLKFTENELIVRQEQGMACRDFNA